MQVVTSMQPQRNGKIVVDVINKQRKKPCGGAVDLSPRVFVMQTASSAPPAQVAVASRTRARRYDA
jgi:hypothetical protein